MGRARGRISNTNVAAGQTADVATFVATGLEGSVITYGLLNAGSDSISGAGAISLGDTIDGATHDVFPFAISEIGDGYGKKVTLTGAVVEAIQELTVGYSNWGYAGFEGHTLKFPADAPLTSVSGTGSEDWEVDADGRLVPAGTYGQPLAVPLATGNAAYTLMATNGSAFKLVTINVYTDGRAYVGPIPSWLPQIAANNQAALRYQAAWSRGAYTYLRSGTHFITDETLDYVTRTAPISGTAPIHPWLPGRRDWKEDGTGEYYQLADYQGFHTWTSDDLENKANLKETYIQDTGNEVWGIRFTGLDMIVDNLGDYAFRFAERSGGEKFIQIDNCNIIGRVNAGGDRASDVFIARNTFSYTWFPLDFWAKNSIIYRNVFKYTLHDMIRHGLYSDDEGTGRMSEISHNLAVFRYGHQDVSHPDFCQGWRNSSTSPLLATKAAGETWRAYVKEGNAFLHLPTTPISAPENAPEYVTRFFNFVGLGARFGVGATASATTDEITTQAAHNLTVGDSIAFKHYTSQGAANGGFTDDVTYYVIETPTATTYKVSATPGGASINITTAGTIEVYGRVDASTNRVIMSQPHGVPVGTPAGVRTKQKIGFRTILPSGTGLDTTTGYYIVDVPDAYSVVISETEGGTPVDITASGLVYVANAHSIKDGEFKSGGQATFDSDNSTSHFFMYLDRANYGLSDYRNYAFQKPGPGTKVYCNTLLTSGGSGTYPNEEVYTPSPIAIGLSLGDGVTDDGIFAIGNVVGNTIDGFNESNPANNTVHATIATNSIWSRAAGHYEDRFANFDETFEDENGEITLEQVRANLEIVDERFWAANAPNGVPFGASAAFWDENDNWIGPVPEVTYPLITTRLLFDSDVEVAPADFTAEFNTSGYSSTAAGGGGIGTSAKIVGGHIRGAETSVASAGIGWANMPIRGGILNRGLFRYDGDSGGTLGFGLANLWDGGTSSASGTDLIGVRWLTSTGLLMLYKKVNGTTAIVSLDEIAFTPIIGQVYEIQAEIGPTSQRVLLDGVQVLTSAETVASGAYGTYHGLLLTGSTNTEALGIKCLEHDVGWLAAA